MTEAYEEVLDYWFGPGDTVSDEVRQRWFKKSEATDRDIRERFGDAVARAGRGELDEWAATPRGRLALVILLDQFTRNIHRERPEAFACDAKAQRLVSEGLGRGDDRELSAAQRAFLYMPLMHAEDFELQNRGVALFEAAGQGSFADYARRHRDIIERFGRFPHRNAVLGRESTTEELEFLREPGSFF